VPVDLLLQDAQRSLHLTRRPHHLSLRDLGRPPLPPSTSTSTSTSSSNVRHVSGGGCDGRPLSGGFVQPPPTHHPLQHCCLRLTSRLVSIHLQNSTGTVTQEMVLS
jgi:hypothetical protein